MASTTKTTNLELSQFVGTDKPAWLTDYNGDMQKIDNGYKKLEDANTATQTDLDATKQDLSGSQTDINNVKANVQALEAQDIALGNRLTVVEGNYDTIHHEVAINTQKITEMEPYAMIKANKKAEMRFNDSSILTASLGGVIGVDKPYRDIESRIVSSVDSTAVALGSGVYVNGNGKNETWIGRTDYSTDGNIVNKSTINFPANGIQFGLDASNNMSITFNCGNNLYMKISFVQNDGIYVVKVDNGVEEIIDKYTPIS